MDPFDRKAREIVDDVIAMVRQGTVRELVIEKLANAMRAANQQWVVEQAMQPPKHDPFKEHPDAA